MGRTTRAQEILDELWPTLAGQGPEVVEAELRARLAAARVRLTEVELRRAVAAITRGTWIVLDDEHPD